jgi:hypothetical protein
MECESEKQVPHPAESAGIRDDKPAGGPFLDRSSTGPKLLEERKLLNRPGGR